MNPMEMLMNMARTNPQVMNVIKLMQSGKMTPEQVYRELAKQRGVDPDSFLKQLGLRK